MVWASRLRDVIRGALRSADILVSDAGVVQVKGVSGHALQVRGDGMG